MMSSKLNQTTHTVLMISPDHFQYNAQTAETNAFQSEIHEGSKELRLAALHEFSQMVDQLRNESINVLVLPSRKKVVTPDAVFPNNWFSIEIINQQRLLILYPMLTENRRAERQVDALVKLLSDNAFSIHEKVDLTSYENDNLALEGTGSLVIDHINQIVYAVISPRTNPFVLDEFQKYLGYRTIAFHAHDEHGGAIYHTNVVMSIGKHFAVISTEAITDPAEKMIVMNQLILTNKTVIDISLAQMQQMAGNILELKSIQGDAKIILSKTAYNIFTKEQRELLNQFGKLVVVNIPVIEKIGGGSARCMLAEIF